MFVELPEFTISLSSDVSDVSLIMLSSALFRAWGKSGGFKPNIDGMVGVFWVLEKPFASLSVLGKMTSTGFPLRSFDYSWGYILPFICILVIYNYFWLIVYSSLLFPPLYLYLQLNLCINYINYFYVNSQSYLRW